MPLEQSILKNIKKVLQVGDDDTSFDFDIIMHINTAFSVLHDLGIGPETGFVIEDDSTTWDQYIEDIVQLSKAKACIFLRVRLIFDPPETTYALAALQKQLEECEVRLSINRENVEWVNPNPVPVIVGDDVFGDSTDDIILDGGEEG